MQVEFSNRLRSVITDLILETDPDNNPIDADNVKVRYVVVSPTDPQRLSSDFLPEMFFQYGTAFQNDEFDPGTNFEGQTLTVLVNIVFEAFPGEDTFTTAARFHDKMREVAKALRMSPGSEDYGIDDTRLSVQPYSQGPPSEFEFLQFAIEIDWFFVI